MDRELDPTLRAAIRRIESSAKEAKSIASDLVQLYAYRDNQDYLRGSRRHEREADRCNELSTELRLALAQLNSVGEGIKAESDRQKRVMDELERANASYDREVKELQRKLNRPPSRPPSSTRVRFPDESTPAGPSQQANNPNRADSVRGDYAADQDLATRALNDGRRKFEEGRYEQAAVVFQAARNAIENLPESSKNKYSRSELDYYLAACTAYDSNVSASEKKKVLSTFVKHYANDSAFDARKLAHVEHLLAQAYAQLGRLDEAREYCNKAFAIRTQFEPSDQRRYESAALLAHIDHLEGNEVAARLRVDGFPEHWKEWYRTKYSNLRPTPNGSDANGPGVSRPSPPRPQPPVGLHRVPTWTLAAQQVKEVIPQKSNPQPTPPRPNPTQPAGKRMDKETRRKWLDNLDLQGPNMNPPFRDAILEGDLERVRMLLTTERGPPRFALHFAAVFGEVGIAELLMRHGGKVGATCQTASEKAGKHCPYVNPLHLAIGARQHAMIRFLDQKQAKFGRPEADSTQTVAPPRWLLSKICLRVAKCEDPQEINATIDTLLSLKWNINAPLNYAEDTMLDVAMGLVEDRTGFKAAIVKHLQSRGGRSRRQLAMSRAPTFDV